MTCRTLRGPAFFFGTFPPPALDLRGKRRDLPIIVVSGYADPALMDRFAADKLVGFLCKLYAVDDLAQALNATNLRSPKVLREPAPPIGPGLSRWYSGAMAAGTQKTAKLAHWPSYEVADYEIVAATPELRMVTITLGKGHEVPWHWHTNISDRFFCMQGPMVIETRAPREVVTLRPGETFVVPPKRAHRVTGENGGPCKFSVLQGTGAYDYNPVGGE